MTGRFQGLKDRKTDLNLLILPIPSSTKLEWCRDTRDPSGPLPSEPVIFGRDGYKHEIIQILKEEDDPKIGVLPIIGMGGLGKTTLARYVYNDKEVKSHFNIRGWVCVSADYDTRRITKDILESVSGNCGDIKDNALGWIQAKLGKEVSNKKFLIVLDDIWNENYRDWNTLMSPLNEGLSGSKIIVTTRSQNVADKVKTVPCIFPNLLSEDDCWSLFCTHANLDPNGTSFFQKAGKEIAKKCSGLPLAAMAVGGMLRDKVRVEEWEETKRTITWASEDVMPVLRMSYNDLAPQLKRCFAFFSLFPEDYKFREDKLVLLWIGAGLIQPWKGGKGKVEVAHDCFHKLLSRSLLSPIRDDGELYMMHDLVRELAQQVSSRNLYIANSDNELIKGTRHLSFNSLRLESILGGGEVRVLPWRTVLSLNGRISKADLPKQMDELFVTLKYVRALSLEFSVTAELPESIGQMILLRYLNLSHNNIQMLPTSITSLHNLEILCLRSCSSLKQLPEKIGRLMHLWYLDITLCSKLKELPEGIKELKKLQKLTHFIVDEKLPVASLGNLKLLQGSLEISGLENVALPQDATLAGLSEKRLDELELNWSYRWRNMEIDSEILEQLQPHENLKVLRIANYGGLMFPGWLSSSFRSLNVLEIKHCGNCHASFTPKNLVSLKELSIKNCAKMEVHLTRMPNLKTLRLENCSYVGCTDTFSTSALDALTLKTMRMSELFKEKVKQGCPNARYLDIAPTYTLCSLSDIIADTYDEEMKVEELYLTCDSSIEHLPQWVSEAKSLKILEVNLCPSLKGLLPYGNIPPALAEITVVDCPQLASILADDPLPETTKPLESIFVKSCPTLKVLLPAKLTMIDNCISVESFHKEILSHCIMDLYICKCPLLSQKLRDGDEQLCSKISPKAYIEVDGDRLHRT